jgi:hypothetical protein
MVYNKTTWADRQIQYPGRFTRTSDGTYDTLTPAPGTISQSGTPITASALNKLETQYDEAVAYTDNLIGSFGQTPWISPVFQNAWINYGNNYEPAGYMRDVYGFVTLKGMIYNGLLTKAAFILPAGYRPIDIVPRGVQSHDGTNVVHAGIEIKPTGNIDVMFGGNTWVKLNGIRFKAVQ